MYFGEPGWLIVAFENKICICRITLSAGELENNWAATMKAPDIGAQAVKNSPACVTNNDNDAIFAKSIRANSCAIIPPIETCNDDARVVAKYGRVCITM